MTPLNLRCVQYHTIGGRCSSGVGIDVIASGELSDAAATMIIA